MLISPAYAQAAGGGGGAPDLMLQLAPFVAIMAVFYFLIIRPQQKRAKEHREALAAIRRNDRIVTTGGLVGIVTKVTEGDDMLTVEIAPGVRVQVVRTMVAEVRGKGQPVAAKPAAKGKGKADKDEEPAEDEQDEAADTPKTSG
jgi:preprotein translocase subunit YajC